MNRDDTDRTRIDILDLLAALHSGKKLIVVATFVVCAATAGFSLLLEDEYEAVVQLLPPKEQKKGFGFADLLSDLPIPALRLGEKGTPADIFVAILKSPTLRRRMVEHFDLMRRYDTDSMERAIEGLEKRTEIGKSEQGTIMIHVRAGEPRLAADMANTYVVFLDSTNIRLSQENANERFAFISKLEEQEEEKLQGELARLQQFQEEHNAISIEDQARATIRAASEMQSAAMELVIKRRSLLLSGFSPSHPEVKRLEKELLMRQEALVFIRDGSDVDLPARSATGQALLESLFLEENLFLPLKQIPEVAHNYQNIEKDVLVQAALMKLLLEQKAEALIEKDNTTSTVQVLDQATAPEKPARPRRLLMVFIAGVLSLFASTVYVLGAVYMRALGVRWRHEFGAARG
jgi:tyrosine-protein kinase Etk/Wzc